MHDTLIIDRGSYISGIGEPAWYIDYKTDKVVEMQGFNKQNLMQKVQIGRAVMACDLPGGSTVLLKVNEISLFGKNGCSLLSIAQMGEKTSCGR